MENIAITVIAYNRKESLKRLLQTLSAAHFGEDKVPLYISVDKSDTDEVEKFADSYVWRFGEKRVVKHASNMGLRRHILSQGLLLDRHDAIIVLEDALTVAPDFWNYAKQTVGKYKDDNQVAGISLYSYGVTNYSRVPFSPIHDGNDVYFMNIAMSWGQVWMKRQWKEFYEWYEANTIFNDAPYLPESLYLWGEKSWLRYHTRFCMENDKYFVYPYVSYSTNIAEVGTHMEVNDNIYQVPLLKGRISDLRLPNPNGNATLYNGFYENKSLYKAIGLSEKECCLDLMGLNNNRAKKRFWLTTKHLGYEIVKRYGCMFRPIEENVLSEVVGNDIFLYDTHVKAKNKFSKRKNIILYTYKIQNGFFWIRDYGLPTIIREFFGTLKFVIKRRFA